MEVWRLMLWKNLLRYLFFNIFDMVFLIYFMEQVYGIDKKNKRNLVFISLLIIIFTTLSMKPKENYFNLEAITIMSFFLLGLFKGNLRKKILFSIILIVVSGFWSSVVYIIFQILYIPHSLIDILINFFGNIGFAIILMGITRLVKNKTGTVTLKLCISLLSIPLLSIVSYFAIIYLLNILPIKRREYLIFYLIISIVILYINFMVFYLFNQYSKLSNDFLEKQLLEKELTFKSKYYYSIEKEHAQVKSVRHDMKNILNTLSYLLESSNAKEAKQFLNNLEYKIDERELIITTGNASLDMVLNMKLTEAQNRNIRLKTDISIPNNLHISFEDAVILLGNIMDNAIEACNKVAIDNRYINLKISYAPGILYLSLLNPYTRMPVINKEGYFITKKRNYKWHGIGMKNVQNIVKKFDGTMTSTYNNGIFKINIILYNIETIITN